MDDNEKARRMFAPHKQIAVDVTAGLEARILAYMDRTNHELGGDEDPYVIGDDSELEIAVACLVRRALDAAEAEYGLHGTDWGELLSVDVARHKLDRDGRL